METEKERQDRRRMRIEEMKREKRRVELLRKSLGIAIAVFAGVGGCFLGMKGAALVHFAAMQEGQQTGEDDGISGGMAGLAVMHEASDELDVHAPDQNVTLAREGGSDEAGTLPGDGVSDGNGMPARDGALPGDGVSDGNGMPAWDGKSPGQGGPGGDGIPPENGMSAWDGTPPGQVVAGEDGMSPGEGASYEDGTLLGKAVPDNRSSLFGQEKSGDDSISGVDAVCDDRMAPEEEVISTLGAAAGYQHLLEAHTTEATAAFDSNINSAYGVVINVDDGMILAEKDAMERMNPASMTKILTVLVAAEHLREEDLDAAATITIDITDYCYMNDCSVTGYGLDETITVRDLFYGTILPSGADSALALAVYVAGSQEAFVDLMNEKLEELGLAQTTHFTNCVGLYDEDHYSTAYDIAVILKAAVDNEFCRDVLSMHIYTTSPTEQHPDGLRVSNMFLRRIEDMDTHGEVLCAKTGYVGQAGNCAASFSLGNDGREYLVVTAGATGSRNCLADHAELYRTFIPE